MRTFLLVCLAGAAGTGARYLIGVALAEASARKFPIATLMVNLAGSFAIGAVTTWSIRRGVPAYLVIVLTTGFLGGFTTYSAFNYELTMYLAHGQSMKAALYALAMVSGCLLAGLAGLHLVR